MPKARKGPSREEGPPTRSGIRQRLKMKKAQISRSESSMQPRPKSAKSSENFKAFMCETDWSDGPMFLVPFQPKFGDIISGWAHILGEAMHPVWPVRVETQWIDVNEEKDFTLPPSIQKYLLTWWNGDALLMECLSGQLSGTYALGCGNTEQATRCCKIALAFLALSRETAESDDGEMNVTGDELAAKGYGKKTCGLVNVLEIEVVPKC